jgi:threonylcarbamoyladenosine tRNA methylthiotransferase MtaB
MDICLESLGCRVNRAEVEALGYQLACAGHHIVDAAKRADLCIINTCAVTAAAERKSRRRVRSVSRDNPNAAIAVVGCYATIAPDVCAALPGVIHVVPNRDKARLHDMLPGTLQLPSASSSRDVADATSDHLHTRAFVKAQDGCDSHCTYCVSSLLRGPARSRPSNHVVADVRRMVGAGFQEVVLTGVNLASYGHDLHIRDGLRLLVERLLVETSVARLRLSSLEPWDLDEAFFDLWGDRRMCRHVHLPLQAGCDDTLRRMGRPISCAAYGQLVASARARIPDLAVTTDIIAGFPGETEAAFRTSYDFVAAMGFARSHVFTFSPRPGTVAAGLPDQLSREVRHARARVMRDLSAEQSSRFLRQFVGRKMLVLWENRRRDGLWSGLTDNYLRVVVRAVCNLHNRITPARLVGARDQYLTAELFGEPGLDGGAGERIPRDVEERCDVGSRSYDT